MKQCILLDASPGWLDEEMKESITQAMSEFMTLNRSTLMDVFGKFLEQ